MPQDRADNHVSQFRAMARDEGRRYRDHVSRILVSLGKTHQPKDYLLTQSPVAGFDYTKTNDTIKNAGRSHPMIMPPGVPATFLTFSFKD